MNIIDRMLGDVPMSIEEFHRKEKIKKRDLEPGDRGIYVTEKHLHEIPHSIDTQNRQLSKEEMHNFLSEVLPSVMTENVELLEQCVREAMSQHLDETQLQGFANKVKNGEIKLESMDTSAVEPEIENTNFVQQVDTPKYSPSLQKSNAPKRTATKDDPSR